MRILSTGIYECQLCTAYNGQLMRSLQERDELHMAQDSMLVDIDDLIRLVNNFHPRRLQAAAAAQQNFILLQQWLNYSKSRWWNATFPLLPFPSFSSTPFPFPPLSSLPLEAGPLNSARGSGGVL